MTVTSRVLVVCTANVCRSPFAAAVLESKATAHRWGDLLVETAGIDAVDGAGPCPVMTAAAQREGVDTARLGAHRSRPLDRDMISAADLILVMDRAGRAQVQRQLPASHTRTFTLRQAALVMTSMRSTSAALVSSPRGPATLTELVRELDRCRSAAGPSQPQRLRVPRRPWRWIETNTLDVPDAHTGRRGDHAATFATLVPAARVVADELVRAAQA